MAEGVLSSRRTQIAKSIPQRSSSTTWTAARRNLSALLFSSLNPLEGIRAQPSWCRCATRQSKVGSGCAHPAVLGKLRDPWHSTPVASWDGDRGRPLGREQPPSALGEVEALATCFLSAADAVVPGLIQGLYLTGSAALGDFRRHSSDVDFVAVSEHRPDGAELQGLAAVHAMVRDRCPGAGFRRHASHLVGSRCRTNGLRACAVPS